MPFDVAEMGGVTVLTVLCVFLITKFIPKIIDDNQKGIRAAHEEFSKDLNRVVSENKESEQRLVDLFREEQAKDRAEVRGLREAVAKMSMFLQMKGMEDPMKSDENGGSEGS